MGLYLGLNLGQASPIVFTLVDFPMTLSADRHLLTVNSCHIEIKSFQVLSSFADVFDVMHFDLFRAVADGTVV